MKSDRGTALTLTIQHDRTLVGKVENHIYLSPSHKINGLQQIIKLKNNAVGYFSAERGNAIPYPVIFDATVAKDQIIIPAEIRKYLACELNQKIECSLDMLRKNEWVDMDEITLVMQKMHSSVIREKEIDVREIALAVKMALTGRNGSYPLQKGQVFVVPFNNARLEFRVEEIKADFSASGDRDIVVGRIGDLTEMKFINQLSHYFKLIGEKPPEEEASSPLTEIPLDFVSKGIGGYKKEIAQMIRTTFYTHAMKQSLLDAYGVVKHSKGILLYGPPGTGKTLIAKCIGELFTQEPIIVIEGSQLKNSYYGATQQNLADLFVVARKNPNRKYVYFFDEMDASFGVRGADSSVSTSNNNDMVSRLLTILDGSNSPKNIIIIGATNRKELIDPALLRAGRIDTHIYMGLPDEKDRLEILQAHTLEMTRTLAVDVDLPEIARLAKNYVGAELAQLVSLARGFAMGKNFTAHKGVLVLRREIKTIEQAEKVTQQHFLRALKEVRPMFGIDEACLNASTDHFTIYNNEIKSIVANFKTSLDSLRYSKGMQQLNFMINGKAGTGKSSLAMYLAAQSQFPHIQVLTASKLLPHALPKQIEIIDEIFSRARQSAEPSVIILDNLENLIEASPDYSQYNNRLRMKMNEVLKEAANGDNKILVIATTESQSFLQRMGLAVHFTESEELNAIHLDCRQAQQCTATISAIANSLNVKTVNDITLKDADLVLDVPLKDLIYQIRKYSSADNHADTLHLGEFLRGLPARYKITHQTENSVQAEVKNSNISFFRQ